MAIKTSLKYSVENLGLVGVRRALWVVDTESAADALSGEEHAVIIAKLDNGSSVGEWTQAKGFGDWSNLEGLVYGGVSVIIALSPLTMTSTKAKGFVDGLRSVIEAMGASPFAVTIPKGESVESLLAKHGGDAKAVVAACKAAAEAAVPDEESTAGEAEIVWDIIEGRFTFHRTPGGELFMLPKAGSGLPVFAWMANESKIKNFVHFTYKRETGRIIQPKVWAAIVNQIEAECAESREVRDLKVRVGEHDGAYWIDLGTDDGQAIELSQGGYRLFNAVPDGLPFAFRRTEVVVPLPVPAQIALGDTKVTLDKLLRRFVNVTDAEWPLLVAYMVNHLLGRRCPILLLVSEAQSGKSTATAAVRFAVEGILTRGEKMPERMDDIAVTLSKDRMTVYNNISFISNELSDLVCQFVGEDMEYKKRKLRTDSETVRLKLDSSLIMNGITTGELRSDFKSRTVRLGLTPINSGVLSDRAINGLLTDAHPQILGSLLALAVETLRILPMAPDQSFSRMVEYTSVAQCIDVTWGMEGQSVESYRMSLQEMSAEGLDNPLFEAIRVLTVTHQNQVEPGLFKATLGGKAIREAYNARWDAMAALATGAKRLAITTGQKLGAELSRHKTDWKRHGVSIEKSDTQSLIGIKDTYYDVVFKADPTLCAWDAQPQYATTF